MKIKAFRKKAVLLTAALMLVAVISLSQADAETATVQGGWLILRSEPSFNGAAMASYPSGTVVTITGQTGAWYAVVAPDGRTGYMLGDYLKQGGSSTGTTARVTSKNGLNVRLRTGPGTGYTIMGSYAPGTQVTVLSGGKDWSKVKIGNYTGYMMSQYLTTGSSGGNGGASFKPVSLPVPDQYTVWVTSKNGKGVNLRSGPSQYYASIGFYGIGTEATMESLGNTWSYIRIGDKYGYMMTEFLTTTTPAGGSGSVIPADGVARVTSSNGKDVNLRTAPGLNAKVIRSYPAGTPLTIITRGEEWYFIHIGDDYGYMMKSFILE